jgi:hypothetical protein
VGIAQGLQAEHGMNYGTEGSGLNAAAVKSTGWT